MKNFRFFVKPICLIVAGLALSACSSRGPDTKPENPYKAKLDLDAKSSPLSDRDLRLQADGLYRRAHAAILDSDYSSAIKYFDQLNERYPFSEYETQSEMEKIYAQYRSYQADEALSGADRFLRSHPRSTQAEYIQYLKGIVNYTRDEGLLDVVGFDSAAKDVGNARRAFGDFALLIQRYPNSPYCGDARRRMIYLRNRIARHEYSIARYYMRRGAYVAAIKRADDILAEYPGAPSTADALKLIDEADHKLGLANQAEEADKIIAFNANNLPVAEPRALAAHGPTIAPHKIDSAPAPDNSAAVATSPSSPPKGFFSRVGQSLESLNPFKHPDEPAKTQIPPTNPTTTDPAPVIPAPDKPVQP